MNTRLLYGYIILVILILAAAIPAQVSKGGRPVSFSRITQTSIQSLTMPSIDRQALLDEDARDAGKDIPFRFGYGFEVNYNLDNSGTWEDLSDGSRLWRLKINCPDAYSINLVYSRFILPEGARFYLYNEDKSQVLGAFTSDNNKEYEKFATAPVKGNTCYLEYYEPAQITFPGEIAVERVVHAYRNLFNYDVVKDFVDFGESGACNNNINCPEGAPWQNEKRSVAMILTGSGQRICTGTLVNNARQDLTPYFLTANHCLGTPETWVFMFNYESPSCTNIDGPTYMTVSGSTLRATNPYSDFALVELSETPPDSFNVYYAGWSVENNATDSSVTIHHPSGDIKKISFDFNALTTSAYADDPGSGDTHWRIGNWEDGTTEGGSSGGPLFDKNHRVIGQLHGGYASCDNILPDWYGKLSISWNYGSTAETRLRDWLDPDSLGVLTLNGRYPSGLLILADILPDTKDSVNDYEVTCQILSQSDLVEDSLLLYFEINSIRSLDTLEQYSGDTTEYHAYIPAQAPGTKIYYYVYARNVDDEIDSSSVYSFRVIDYDLELNPAYSSRSTYRSDTLWYDMQLVNTGVYTDSYSLNLTGNDWASAIWDETGNTVISATGSVPHDDTFSFKVSVEIPGDAEMNMTDSVRLEAVSAGNNDITAVSYLFSFSSGTPERFPWFEPFLTDTLNSESWSYNNGAVPSVMGLNTPSLPYSLRLDGGNDTVITGPLNLASQNEVMLSYYYQRTGGGEPPDADDDLVVQYLNSSLEWITINTHLGSGYNMNFFEQVNYGLPSDAFHDNFRLRLYSIGTYSGYDDWFADDIRVDYPPAINVLPTLLSASINQNDSTTENLIIENDGQGGLSYSIQIVPAETYKSNIYASLSDASLREPSRRKYPDNFNEYVDIKGADDPRTGFPVEKDAGGPDAYGYTWIDSDDPTGPDYAWVDVSSTGIDIGNDLSDDNYGGPYPLGFAFDYYGGTYNEIYVGSNGIIGFSPESMASRYKTSIPDTSLPNNILAWLWDDLDADDDFNTSDHVYLDTSSNRCVVQFVNYPEFGADVGDVVTAEVIIYADGSIRFQYQSIAPGFDVNNCTVGIENQDGTDGLEVAFLTPYLHDELAIVFYRPYQWLNMAKQAGSLDPGTADTIACCFTSESLDSGSYFLNLEIYSNDPYTSNNPWIIPVELNVSGHEAFICGDINNSGGEPDISDITYLISYLYLNGPPPVHMEAADTNNSGGEPDIADITRIISFLYLDGPDLVCP
ncbi:MAG: trypsin-like serine peptidase [Candidatus Zixiibacteriota bacterium]